MNVWIESLDIISKWMDGWIDRLDAISKWMDGWIGYNLKWMDGWIGYHFKMDGWLDWLPFQSRTMRSCQAPRNQELSPPEPTL